MKKIIILIFTLLFLTSCSLFTTKTEQSTNTDKKNTEDKTDKVVSKDNEKDQKNPDKDSDKKDMNSNEINDDISEKSSAPDEKKINSVSSTKSDDELVEEAIKDIESLFDDIEKSVK